MITILEEKLKKRLNYFSKEFKQHIFEHKIEELSKNDILKGVDGKFIHHDDYVSDLKSKIGSVGINSGNWYLDKVEGSTLTFKIHSATTNKFYINKISFTDEYEWLKSNFKFGDYDLDTEVGKKELVQDMKDYWIEIIDNGDMLLYCSCPAFLYWGYQYLATQMDYELRRKPEGRSPDIRNPNNRGSICKHLDVTLNALSNNKIKEYVVEYLTDKFLSSQTSRKYKDIPEEKKFWWLDYFTTLK